MNGIQVFGRHIGDGNYQIFIKNIDYRCDFIRLGGFLRHKKGDDKDNYIFYWMIISPFKEDSEEIFVTTVNVELLKDMKMWFVLDTCLSKPSRFIESLQIDTPAASKLPKTIGRTADFKVSKRKEQTTLQDYVEAVRPNIRQRIEDLIIKYNVERRTATINEAWREFTQDRVIGQEYLEQLMSLDYSDEYNSGMSLQQATESNGVIYATYYEWFLKDYGLSDPHGITPELRFEVPKPKVFVHTTEDNEITPEEYRQRLLAARDAYYRKIESATYEQQNEAMANDKSVAEAEADEFIELDFTVSYNHGEKPEDMNPAAAKKYRLFIKAFDLPEPTGKPPKKRFTLTDY